MAFTRKYDHLFFDLDNTLWDFDANAKITMQQTVTELKLGSQVEDFEEFYAFYEKVNSGLWKAFQRQEIRKPELIKKRFADTLSHFNIKGIDPVTMNELYLDIMPEQKTLVDGAIDLLEYLKASNYHLHIISNGFKKVQTRKLKSSGLEPYFDQVFVSEEAEAPKPDVRIFRHALSNCNASKKKSLMIGDSFETDIIGAYNFGIDQLYFEKEQVGPILNGGDLDKNQKNNTHASFLPTYSMKCLSNVKSIL